MLSSLSTVLILSVASSVPLAPDTGRITLPVSVESKGLTLHGSLELPRGAGPFPVVLIVAGSGPTDRDGNNAMLPGKNNGLKQLAEQLADRGIASLRYDKRGIGQSTGVMGSEADLRFTMYADDAAAWIPFLRKDARFNRVVVAGHSEGALLGTMAARAVGADGVVLIAGAGRRVGVILREQLRHAVTELQAPVADSILRELEQGRKVQNVPADLMMIFRESIQPYMMSWLPLDPAAELARITVPILVIRGTTDVQATHDDALRLAAANKRARLVEIEGMNHVLKFVSGTAAEQMPSYSDPALPLVPKLVDTIAEFITRDVK